MAKARTGGDRAHGVLHVGERRTRWRRRGPLDGRPLIVLTHGAGAGHGSPFMSSTRDGLLARGCTVVSLNFCYMQRMEDERRRRPPDPMPVLMQTLALMVERVQTWCEALPSPAPLIPVTLVGKSMGGRVSSLLLAEGLPPEVRGSAYLGYPLHPAGKPERLRRDHLPSVTVPQLFISGTADALAARSLLASTVASLGPLATLHWIEGADHSLAVRRVAPLDGADHWLDLLAGFIDGLPAR